MNVEKLREDLIILLQQIAPEVDYDEVEPTDDIQEELEIDSFDYLNFLIAIDELYGVEIPERDYAGVRTLQNLEAYLLERIV